jgi:hypothetical protein
MFYSDKTTVSCIPDPEFALEKVPSINKYIHYRSNVWGHLEILVLEGKAHFCPLK